MINRLKNYVKKTILSIIYIKIKRVFTKPKPQNDESIIINRLLNRYKVPKTFIEFGFSGWEFNCADLVNEWVGYLVDGDIYNIRIARSIFKKNITAESHWITLDNIHIFKKWLNDRELGILSIDVDGNDYYFLKELVALRPSIIIIEYNSSFKLRPITVKYDPKFDRKIKHSSWTYFGVSLSAVNFLLNSHGYSLIEVGNSGVNAFFVRNDYISSDDLILNPKYVFREKLFKDNSRPSHQWEVIKDMEYIDVITEKKYYE